MSLIFKKVIITDIKNKEAKKIEFSPKMNLVTSDKNSKGKSIIMKSLYHSMGANCLFDGNFKKDEKIFDLYFSYNSNDYEIIRFKNDYVLLKEKKLVESIKYGEIRKLANFYKQELNMFVYLKDRQGDVLLAPPAYLFIPYYLDQDISWKNEQEPFENLGQFEKLSRNQLYFYHLDILSNQYFELDSQLKNNCEKLNKIKAELKTKDTLYADLQKELGSKVVLDIKELDIELRNLKYLLLEKTEKIEDLKSKIYDKENDIISLEFLIQNIDSALKKINKKEGFTSKHVACPNCKYEFDVNLKAEIESLYDNEYLINRKEKCKIDIEAIKDEVKKLKNDLNGYLNDVKVAKEKIFNKEVNYKDYLNQEVIQRLLINKAEDIAKLEEAYEIQKTACVELQTKLDRLDEKKIQVGPIFKKFYKENLISLGVHSFNENSIKAFYKLAISGSLYVRSTLAFFYSFLDTKTKFNSQRFMCPLVIDSPRDGEQDDINSNLILEYIFNRNVDNYQLIVASVDAEKFLNEETLANKDLKIIRITGQESNHLLNKEEYTQNIKEIEKSMSYFGIL